MANGWISDADNAAMASDMSRCALMCVSRAAAILNMPSSHRREAIRDRERFRDTREDGTDSIGLAISCALVLADRLSGFSKERVPGEVRWLASVAYQALSLVRISLSDPRGATFVGADVNASRVGTSAATLELPASFRDTLSALLAWTDDLLERMPIDLAPGTMTLDEAIQASGGTLPCAVVLDGEVGSPIVVTQISADGIATGFPTIGFQPSDRWARRNEWLTKLLIQDASTRRWSPGQARPEVLKQAQERLHSTLLPNLRKVRPTMFFKGARVMAEEIGVTVPRLAAWMRQEGHLVRGGAGWVPNPAFGRETVFAKTRDERVVYLWSPTFLDSLRNKTSEISATPITRGVASPRQPSAKQSAFLEKIAKQAGVEVPEAVKASGKLSASMIDQILKERPRYPSDQEAKTLIRLAKKSGVEIPVGTLQSAKLLEEMMGRLARDQEAAAGPRAGR